MIGVPFVVLGAEAVKDPGPRAERVTTVGPKVARALHLPEDPVSLVRINGAAQVGAGALLAIGRLPRLAALVLAGSLVPTTLTGHPFWEETDKQRRAHQQVQFLKNVGLLGGLLLAVVDPGRRRRAPRPG